MNPTTTNTVKPTLRRNRERKTVENNDFAAFARRILRAYARRVADGDVEALRSLSTFACDVDSAMSQAVHGLRAWNYSWTEIADRLGVSRQAAQMRWGTPNERGALDRRLLTDGISVSVSTLVAVFVDHHPGIPPATTCPGCGHTYRDEQRDCPTNTVVRPLLYRRRHEDQQALTRLTPAIFADLHDRRAARASRLAARIPATPPPRRGQASLLDLTPGGEP